MSAISSRRKSATSPSIVSRKTMTARFYETHEAVGTNDVSLSRRSSRLATALKRAPSTSEEGVMVSRDGGLRRRLAPSSPHGTVMQTA